MQPVSHGSCVEGDVWTSQGGTVLLVPFNPWRKRLGVRNRLRQVWTEKGLLNRYLLLLPFQNGFAVVRPPGHHADHSTAM